MMTRYLALLADSAAMVLLEVAARKRSERRGARFVSWAARSAGQLSGAASRALTAFEAMTLVANEKTNTPVVQERRVGAEQLIRDHRDVSVVSGCDPVGDGLLGFARLGCDQQRAQPLLAQPLADLVAPVRHERARAHDQHLADEGTPEKDTGARGVFVR
jgi:hypothetical protein